jgi:hypothetical protein
MRQWWLAFGCFLTGYNYQILRGCSEASARRVLRYTSAMIIPCVLWAFVGYNFASRYLKLEFFPSLLTSLVMIIFVVQIERQVILSSAANNRAPFYLRTVIAFAMALIGSIIIDQILFSEDLDQERIIMLDEKVKKILPAKSAELRTQIAEIDSAISLKDIERKQLFADISSNPTIPVYSREVKREIKDTLTTEVVTRSSSHIENPKIALLEPLDSQLASLRKEKMQKDSMMLAIRPTVEAELKQNVGFLDELQLMLSILLGSAVAFCVWFLFFFFFFGIEAFVLISKWKETETDYDEVIRQQSLIHLKRIELLSKQ